MLHLMHQMLQYCTNCTMYTMAHVAHGTIRTMSLWEDKVHLIFECPKYQIIRMSLIRRGGGKISADTPAWQ